MVRSSLVVHLVAPDLEARVVASDVNPLSDAERQELVQLVLTARQAQASGPMIILTTLDVKRRLRRLIADELPDVRVIAYRKMVTLRQTSRRARVSARMLSDSRRYTRERSVRKLRSSLPRNCEPER